MDVAWRHPDAFLAVREVLEQIEDPLAYTTVMTVMNRLYEKAAAPTSPSAVRGYTAVRCHGEAFAAATMSEVLNTADDRRSARCCILSLTCRARMPMPCGGCSPSRAAS